MLSSDVYWEAVPMTTVSKVFGVAPFGKNYRISKANLAVSLLMVATVFVATVYLSLKMEEANGMLRLSHFSLLLERVQLFIVTLCVIVAVTKSIINVNFLRKVMRSLSAADQDLLRIGVSVPHSRVYSYLVLCIRLTLLTVLFICDASSYDILSNPRYVIVEFIIIIPTVVGNVVQTQFIILLDLVKRRMALLSNKLNSFVRTDDFVKTNKLQTLASVHSSLLTICSIINWLYSPQILILFSSIFVSTTMNLYHVIEKIVIMVRERKMNSIRFICTTSLRICIRSYEIWSMVTACDKTQGEAKEFNTLLYQLMIDDKTNDISNNKKLRLHIAMKREVVFTACGFFTLDYTLVHSMIAAATTYLVILIQFGQPSNADSGPPSNTSFTNTTDMPLSLTSPS